MGCKCVEALYKYLAWGVSVLKYFYVHLVDEKDEINVPMVLSVFRDGAFGLG